MALLFPVLLFAGCGPWREEKTTGTWGTRGFVKAFWYQKTFRKRKKPRVLEFARGLDSDLGKANYEQAHSATERYRFRIQRI
jgi:hypothetical protein